MTRYKNSGLALCMIFATVVMLLACQKESAFQKKERPELVITADDPRLQSANIHFRKDTVYVLATDIIRDSGENLLIEAGTLIKVNVRISIVINEGATIDAEGRADDPIIFTSSAGMGGAGVGTGASGGERYWHGIKLYGSATKGSGILKYVRIEFAGYENITGASLLLQNISIGTTLENIQVSYSFRAPSFEFSGGNCNARNLVSYASSFHDFYIHDGYKGMLQHLLAWRHPYFPNSRLGANLAGLMIEGSGTFPTISNLTVIGPDLQNGTSVVYSDTVTTRVASLIAAANSKFHIRNTVFLAFPKNGFFLGDRGPALSLSINESDFAYSMVHCNDSSRVFYLPSSVYPPYTSRDFKNYMLEPQFGNQIFLNSSDFKLTRPYDYDTDPDPSPASGSPVLSGANFDGIFR